MGGPLQLGEAVVNPLCPQVSQQPMERAARQERLGVHTDSHSSAPLWSPWFLPLFWSKELDLPCVVHAACLSFFYSVLTGTLAPFLWKRSHSKLKDWFAGSWEVGESVLEKMCSYGSLSCIRVKTEKNSFLRSSRFNYSALSCRLSVFYPTRGWCVLMLASCGCLQGLYQWAVSKLNIWN